MQSEESNIKEFRIIPVRIERILKTLIKTIESNHLTPRTLES